MKPEIAAMLREPFAPENVGKLPRVWCSACRDARGKVCQSHTKVRCRDCGNNITSAHLHLDYVGHAEITDRLLKADPEWTWEPAAFGSDGLPARDQMGGLWIRLTVSGVTRLGYGHADGKSGPDAVKEAIGDALRNAAMRFGVALDLWGATFKEGTDEHDAQGLAPEATPEEVDQEQHRHMHALWRDLGYAGDGNRETRLDLTAKILRLPSLASSADLTREQADTVIAALRNRKRQLGQQSAEQQGAT